MTKFNTVVITGANRGLGLEFVNHYAQVSQRVVACCRNPETATELNKIAATLDNIAILPLNVTHQNQIKGLSAYLGESAVDLLINNAGVYGPKEKEKAFDSEIWTHVFEVNCIAPIQIARAISVNLAMSPNAVVANITSKMGSISDNTSGGSTIYRSSKAALNAATKSFALDNQSRGITTVLLHPGWVQTDMGGPNGLINTATSIHGLCKVLEGLTPDQNGQFFDYQGKLIPW